MSDGVEIRGRGVVKGQARGTALVADTTLSFWGEIDAVSGRVISVGHPLEGECLAGRVLVIRSTKGSSATPMMLRLAHLEGNAPVAMVNVEVDGLAALGCIVNEIPMITDLELDPFEAIVTGDEVVVNADAGVVRVIKSSTASCRSPDQEPGL
jgi:predicted aconitase with swiveling domain